MADRWTVVLDELRQRFAADADVVEVKRYLTSKGYSQRQIGEILSLLHRHNAGSASPLASEAGVAIEQPPLRVQGPHERGRFSTDAWGYLLTLHRSGTVGSHEFEQLVERALTHVDGRIGLTEIRAFAEAGGLDDGGGDAERSRVH